MTSETTAEQGTPAGCPAPLRLLVNGLPMPECDCPTNFGQHWAVRDIEHKIRRKLHPTDAIRFELEITADG